MQDEELRELKAAVFGRGAAQLPPAERAILERRLARELAVREVVPEPAGHDSSEAEPAGHDSTEAEPASSGGPDLRPQQSVEPDTPLQGPPRRLPLRMMLAAAAAGLVAIIAVGALQFAEPPRDSLAVFDAAPTSVDAAAPRRFGLDGEAEFRALGESGGHRLFAALRTVPVEGARVANRAAPAPGTDSSDAIFLHPVDATTLP